MTSWRTGSRQRWKRSLESVMYSSVYSCGPIFNTQDRVAINKIRNRVLLDLARDKLAGICGFNNWKDWKTNVGNREMMLRVATSWLGMPGANISEQWKALGQRSTALRILLLPNPIRSRGDVAAHGSAQKHIGESILALTVEQERKDMSIIFRAVFGTEPAIE
jgi:hypothetical protein